MLGIHRYQDLGTKILDHMVPERLGFPDFSPGDPLLIGHSRCESFLKSLGVLAIYEMMIADEKKVRDTWIHMVIYKYRNYDETILAVTCLPASVKFSAHPSFGCDRICMSGRPISPRCILSIHFVASCMRCMAVSSWGSEIKNSQTLISSCLGVFSKPQLVEKKTQ